MRVRTLSRERRERAHTFFPYSQPQILHPTQNARFHGQGQSVHQYDLRIELAPSQGQRYTRRYTTPKHLWYQTRPKFYSNLVVMLFRDPVYQSKGKFVTIMAKFRQKVLDVGTWQPIEGLETQSSVFCNTRTSNLMRTKIQQPSTCRESGDLTRSAARRHFSRATSWVDP